MTWLQIGDVFIQEENMLTVQRGYELNDHFAEDSPDEMFLVAIVTMRNGEKLRLRGELADDIFAVIEPGALDCRAYRKLLAAGVESGLARKKAMHSL